MYRTLDPDKIIATLDALSRRIAERFPGAGLGKVAADLLDVARTAQARADKIAEPYLGLRALILLVLIAGLSGIAMIARHAYRYGLIKIENSTEFFGAMQGIDAAVNLLIVMSVAIFTLFRLETRMKRSQALGDLHQLRSIIHVIDMHQLTKDPSAVLGQLPSTQSSPARVLSALELMRYLDYCSEMLSLSSKVAAIYAQNLRDAVVIGAVNELEQLTTNLSHKIWQKITILERTDPEAARATISAPAD